MLVSTISRPSSYADGTECPKCGKASKFHRISGRTAYSCQFCGHHVYPTAGTIFHKSTVSLQFWVYGLPNVLDPLRDQREAIGVRDRRDVQDRSPHVQADPNPVVSGRRSAERRGRDRRNGVRRQAAQLVPQARYRKPGDWSRHNAGQRWAKANKTSVLGMVERGGRVRAEVVPDRLGPTLQGRVIERVLPASMIFTDEWKSYTGSTTSQVIVVFSTARRSTCVGMCTRTQSRDSSGCSRPAFVASITPSAASTCSPTWTSTRGDTTIATTSQPMFWTILDGVQKDRLAAS